MAKDINLLISLTTTVVSHRSIGEETDKYVTLPATDENLEFIKALYQIAHGKVNLTDVSVGVARSIIEETDMSNEEATSND